MKRAYAADMTLTEMRIVVRFLRRERLSRILSALVKIRFLWSDAEFKRHADD